MAATTIATTMAMLKNKAKNRAFLNSSVSKPKPISLLSIQNLPKSLIKTTKLTTETNLNLSSSLIAGAIFSTLSSCDAAFAAQQIAEIAAAEGSSSDNRGLALLLPIIPAIAWVLFNILQPALNQINKMRSDKGVVIGLGLTGLAATSTGFVNVPEASAATVSEVAMIADAAASDNRGQLLLFVVSPALLWVGYNILQPALNQINKMRSD